jgi:hypothetical protein
MTAGFGYASIEGGGGLIPKLAGESLGPSLVMRNTSLRSRFPRFVLAGRKGARSRRPVAL